MIKPESVNPLTKEQEEDATRLEAQIDADLQQRSGEAFYCGGDSSANNRTLRVVARRYEAAGWAVRLTRNAERHLHLRVLHPLVAWVDD